VPFGSALSFILLSAVLIMLFFYVRFGDAQNESKSD